MLPFLMGRILRCLDVRASSGEVLKSDPFCVLARSVLPALSGSWTEIVHAVADWVWVRHCALRESFYRSDTKKKEGLALPS